MMLHIWFKDDVTLILVSVMTAAGEVAAAGNPSPEWMAGYVSALRAVAAAFDINLNQLAVDKLKESRRNGSST